MLTKLSTELSEEICTKNARRLRLLSSAVFINKVAVKTVKDILRQSCFEQYYH